MISKQDSSRFDNLRFRPFLVIEAFVTPASGVRTERKDWKKGKETQKVTEHPTVVDRITSKIMRRAEVIIDIANDSLLKNRLTGDSIVDQQTYGEEVFSFYKRKYADIIRRGKEVWVAQLAAEAARDLMRKKVSA